MRILTIILLFISIFAQAQIFKHAPIVLRTDENDTTKAYSSFPVFSSATRPKVATVINKTLQMMCFIQIPTHKNPNRLVTWNDEEYMQWTYEVDDSDNRLLHVITRKWTPPGGMHTPDYTTTTDFLFDRQTGDWGDIKDRSKTDHLWSGMIGGKIPLTLLLYHEDGALYGREVYDNFGIIIYLKCTQTGNIYRLEELGDNNETIGYFEVSINDDGALAGVWKKGDGSKQMDFKAMMGVR